MRTLIIIHYLFKFSPLVEMTMMTILAHESFTLSSRTGVQNNSYYAETIVSTPNPCDSYLGHNIDTVLQLYDNDGSFENPVKGTNRVGGQRTGSVLFTRDYLTALNRLNIGVGSTFSIDAIVYTVQEYNCN